MATRCDGTPVIAGGFDVAETRPRFTTKGQAMRSFILVATATATLLTSPFADAQAKQAKKPNIVIIWGDDIGQSNVSDYTGGLMGYKTPNIDSVAKDGMIFTDYYAEQSCTAGRASFITGQHGMRTGLTKVGMPGAKAGMQKEDPT